MPITPDPKFLLDYAAKARALSRLIEDPAMHKRLEEIAERYDILAEMASRALTPALKKRQRERRR
jgi:hypothetical protein